jgi:hypothetical protein
MSNEINIVEIRSREGGISGTTFWNSQVELLSDKAIIELLNHLSDMIKNVNGMLALRLTDMSNRRMENINALDNPEEINKNFRILADRLSKQEKQLKAFLERSKDDE